MAFATSEILVIKPR